MRDWWNAVRDHLDQMAGAWAARRPRFDGLRDRAEDVRARWYEVPPARRALVAGGAALAVAGCGGLGFVLLRDAEPQPPLLSTTPDLTPSTATSAAPVLDPAPTITVPPPITAAVPPPDPTTAASETTRRESVPTTRPATATTKRPSTATTTGPVRTTSPKSTSPPVTAPPTTAPPSTPPPTTASPTTAAPAALSSAAVPPT